MLPVFRNEEPLFALSFGAADLHIDLGETFGLRRFDADDLPGQLRIVAKRLVHETVDIVFGRQAGIGRTLRCRGLRLRRRLLLSGNNAGRQ